MGADRIALPLVRHRFLRGLELTTGIVVMNVGSSPTSATITYRDQHGTETTGCAGCSATIGPGQAWRPDVTTGVRAGTYGSAMVESDGQPLIAIVSDFSYTGATDVATYNGIPINDAAPTENFMPFACANAR